MSELKVEVLRVVNVDKHPNADRLDCIQLLGWNVIVAKDSFAVGDLGIYFPIDSVLPANIEEIIFPPDSKIKLEKSRVKTIKLRGCVSQGLFVRAEVLGIPEVKEGQDLTEKLGVTKYEPREDSMPEHMRMKSTNPKKRKDNPNLCKYTDIDHLKKFPHVLIPGEEVYISEKIHGTSVRVGIVENIAITYFDKIKKFFHLLPKWQKVWGSRNIQIQNKWLNRSGYYKEDVYTKIVKQYNLFDKIENGTIIFGEIYGCNIQAGYAYGCTNGNVKLVVYDVMVDGKYLNFIDFRNYCDKRNLPRVPELFVGPFDLDNAKRLSQGFSILCSEQKVREGIVIKPIKERVGHCGRVVLKLLNDDYLLKEQTDFH